MQRLARQLIPDQSCLALISDADGLDCLLAATAGFEVFDGSLDAVLDRGKDLPGILLVPTAEKKDTSAERYAQIAKSGNRATGADAFTLTRDGDRTV